MSPWQDLLVCLCCFALSSALKELSNHMKQLNNKLSGAVVSVCYQHRVTCCKNAVKTGVKCVPWVHSRPCEVDTNGFQKGIRCHDCHGFTESCCPCFFITFHPKAAITIKSANKTIEDHMSSLVRCQILACFLSDHTNLKMTQFSANLGCRFSIL